MAEAAAHLIDHVIPKVPVRQWVLSFLIPLRSLFAVHPELLAPVLQIIHRSIATFLFKQTGIKRDQAATGAVTLIQRFGSAANVRYTENSSTPVTDSNWPTPVDRILLQLTATRRYTDARLNPYFSPTLLSSLSISSFPSLVPLIVPV
jgi:hypothetical protein